jgi:hypothetical protein
MALMTNAVAACEKEDCRENQRPKEKAKNPSTGGDEKKFGACRHSRVLT